MIKVADGIGYDGFCIDLLIEMSKILNFTFEIFEVEDGAYGVRDDSGQWNGIIGVLQRHEADLSVSAVTITYSRVTVVGRLNFLGLNGFLKTQRILSKCSGFRFYSSIHALSDSNPYRNERR